MKDSIPGLDSHIIKSTINTFNSMTSLHLQVTEDKEIPSLIDDYIMGNVGFAGNKIKGGITIYVTQEFGKIMASQMLCMDVADVNLEEDIYDVVGEIGNMIAGAIKNTFLNYDDTCILSIPTVITGKGINLEVINWSSRGVYGFKYENFNITLIVYIKKP